MPLYARKGGPGAYLIQGHHVTALTPAAAGGAYYFGWPHDGAAVTDTSARGFKFPISGNIIAASLTISVTGSVGTSSPVVAATLQIRNRATSSSQLALTASGSGVTGNTPYGVAWSAYNASGLSLAVNDTDTYAFQIDIPAHSGTNPTSIRHYASFLVQRP